MDYPEFVQHPGRILLSEIEKIGMNQKELALRTGVSEKHICTVVKGDKNISASFARKLEIALGSEKGFWLKCQTNYDQYQIRLEEKNNITDEEMDIVQSMKEIVDYFISSGIIDGDCGAVQKVLLLRDVLRVSNLSSIPKITYNAAYRAQIASSTNINVYTLFAWQRLCEICTEAIICRSEFDVNKLQKKIDDIKQLMFERDPNLTICKLSEIFSECGIAFAVVRHFRGAPVQGFIKQRSTSEAILCLTIRGKKADRFWFSLFHEIGHLVNGDLGTRFVDFDSVKCVTEDKADRFARDTLIPAEKYNAFVNSGKYINLLEIKRFSKSVNVPHWIVIGRLHSDEWLDWSRFNNEIPSYSWVEKNE